MNWAFTYVLFIRKLIKWKLQLPCSTLRPQSHQGYKDGYSKSNQQSPRTQEIDLMRGVNAHSKFKWRPQGHLPVQFRSFVFCAEQALKMILINPYVTFVLHWN